MPDWFANYYCNRQSLVRFMPLVPLYLLKTENQRHSTSFREYRKGPVAREIGL